MSDLSREELERGQRLGQLEIERGTVVGPFREEEAFVVWLWENSDGLLDMALRLAQAERERDEARKAHDLAERSIYEFHIPTLAKAAARAERLEAALRQILTEWDEGMHEFAGRPIPVCNSTIHAAREALAVPSPRAEARERVVKALRERKSATTGMYREAVQIEFETGEIAKNFLAALDSLGGPQDG